MLGKEAENACRGTVRSPSNRSHPCRTAWTCASSPSASRVLLGAPLGLALCWRQAVAERSQRMLASQGRRQKQAAVAPRRDRGASAAGGLAALSASHARDPDGRCRYAAVTTPYETDGNRRGC